MAGVILFSNKLKDAWLDPDKENMEALKSLGGLDNFCKHITDEINFVNSKYEVEEIKFIDNDSLSENMEFNSKAAGFIATEKDDKYKPLAYICVSNPRLGSRNAMGSQQLFPNLSLLIDRNLSSPGFELVNLPVYFVYGSKDSITSSMKQTIIAMILMGVRCIPVIYDGKFITDSEREELKKEYKIYSNYDLLDYAKFLSNSDSKSDDLEEISTDYFVVNKSNKTVKFIADSFNSGSFGSKDRFFVIKAYAALILADNMGYRINIDEIEKFVETVGSGKNNFLPFIKYAKKLFERRKG